MWKCLPVEYDSIIFFNNESIAHSNFPITEFKKDENKKLKKSLYHKNIYLDKFCDSVTNKLVFRIIQQNEILFNAILILEKPYRIEPAFSKILYTYKEISPTILIHNFGSEDYSFKRIAKDVCGDEFIEYEIFSHNNTTILAFPTADFRLSTTNGWVFSEKIELDREYGIPNACIWKMDPSIMFFLGDFYLRELTRVIVDTSKNSATTIFALGDFSGCFGAGCGDPVNIRYANVEFQNGAFSLHLKDAIKKETDE